MRRTTLDFDELNELDEFRQLEKQVKKTKKRSFPAVIPYRDFFGAMYIEPEEMNERISLAKQIEDVMLWVFAYWIIAQDAGISKDELKQDAKDKLTSIISKRTKLDPYLEKHINDVINEVVDTTEKHAKKKEDEDEEGDLEQFLTDDDERTIDEYISPLDSEKPNDSSNKDYWTSRERAMLISENEANAFYNYEKYREAKIQGKTKKTWHTELDEKVRMTHTLAEGQTVDIDGLFLIGGSEMRFPKDTEHNPDPSEVVNCRCTCEYK
jgi:NTP pyrophosphatase (non-canonical NTP hydrolase)